MTTPSVSRGKRWRADLTMPAPGLAESLATDPVEVLADRFRPVAARAVDVLQIAAALESSGVTDRVARVQYGYSDVFELAQAIRDRTGVVLYTSRPAIQRPWLEQLRDIGHGGLYLLPAVLFPAAFAVVGSSRLIVAVVLVGALGWVWSGVVAWLAYRLVSEGRPGAAADLWRWASLGALPVAAGAAAVAADVTGIGHAVAAVTVLALAQTAYQLAAAVLVFYRREGLLLAAMLPGVAGAAGYLWWGEGKLSVAVAASLVSVVVLFGLALRQATLHGQQSQDDLLPGSLAARWSAALPVAVFTGLSAAFLLWPQVRHVLVRFDVAVALLPVVVGMGVVEWRARWFVVAARGVLARAGDPAAFVRGVWLRLCWGLVVCVVVVAALGVGLLVLLERTGLGLVAPVAVGRPALLMAVAAAGLAGAYYLGFVLANLGRYGVLSGSLAVCLAGYVVAGWLVGGDVLADVAAFLAATVVLIGCFLVGLVGRVGRAHLYR